MVTTVCFKGGDKVNTACIYYMCIVMWDMLDPCKCKVTRQGNVADTVLMGGGCNRKPHHCGTVTIEFGNLAISWECGSDECGSCHTC